MHVDNGRMLKENEDVSKRWSKYFERLMNVINQGKAVHENKGGCRKSV